MDELLNKNEEVKRRLYKRNSGQLKDGVKLRGGEG